MSNCYNVMERFSPTHGLAEDHGEKRTDGVMVHAAGCRKFVKKKTANGKRNKINRGQRGVAALLWLSRTTANTQGGGGGRGEEGENNNEMSVMMS